MKYYARIKSDKVEEILRTENPSNDMVECNKPIFIKGKRYLGNFPKKGFVYKDGKFYDRVD